MSLDQICNLLSYVNGRLTDDSDDVIDDELLYFMFVRLASRAKELYRAEDREALLEEALQSYQEPVPGARERIKKALRIMLTAWLASRMYQQCEIMLKETADPIIEKENVL